MSTLKRRKWLSTPLDLFGTHCLFPRPNFYVCCPIMIPWNLLCFRIILQPGQTCWHYGPRAKGSFLPYSTARLKLMKCVRNCRFVPTLGAINVICAQNVGTLKHAIEKATWAGCLEDLTLSMIGSLAEKTQKNVWILMCLCDKKDKCKRCFVILCLRGVSHDLKNVASVHDAHFFVSISSNLPTLYRMTAPDA